MRRSLPFLAACIVAAGCGGPGSFNGKVGGYALDVKDAILLRVQVPGVTGTFAGILLGDQTGLCKAAQNNVSPKNLTTLSLLAGVTDSTGQAFSTTVSAGTFPVSSNGPGANQNVGEGIFDKVDASCHSVFTSSGTTAGPNQATSGKVVLSTLKLAAGGNATGTFDLTFGSGDHATGSFSAPFCDANLNNSNQPTCQ